MKYYVICLMLLFYSSIYGASPDFNGDGICDVSDFILFTDALGGHDSRFDLNDDGAVSIADFLIFMDNFGNIIIPYSGADRAATVNIRNARWEVSVYVMIPEGQEYIALPFDPATILAMPQTYQYSLIIYQTPLTFDFPFLFVVGNDQLCVRGDCSSFAPPAVVVEEETEPEERSSGTPSQPMYVFVGTNQWEPLFVSVIGNCSLGGFIQVSLRIVGHKADRTATVYLADLGMPRSIGEGYYDWGEVSVVGNMVVFVPPLGCKAIGYYPGGWKPRGR